MRTMTCDSRQDLPPEDNGGACVTHLGLFPSPPAVAITENCQIIANVVILLAIREQLGTNLGQSRTNEYKFETRRNGLITIKQNKKNNTHRIVNIYSLHPTLHK